MNRAVIGIGSNIDPALNIARACDALGQRHTVLAQSQIVETEPIGLDNQPNYLNTTLLVETVLDREAFRKELHEIERRQGRVRTSNKYERRTIDLDIVVWNGQVVDDDLYERDFLRQGVREICPQLEL